jgi:hypothetical protein
MEPDPAEVKSMCMQNWKYMYTQLHIYIRIYLVICYLICAIVVLSSKMIYIVY